MAEKFVKIQLTQREARMLSLASGNIITQEGTEELLDFFASTENVEAAQIAQRKLDGQIDWTLDF